jgi:hypothetical protein
MLATRLANQRLTRTTFRRADQVVSWLGAVQAQDYAGAQWGVALRARGLSTAAIDRAYAAGQILRTHVMRSTWHLVAAADIRWLQALTGPRVQMSVRGHGRRIGLDTRTFTRARVLIERALEGGHHLTRTELAAVLRRGRIEAEGQRLAVLVMDAELEAAICSGPSRGRQFTAALVAERAPAAQVLPRDEALAELSKRYFQSHGPATVHDFAWWSGLTVADARAGAATVPSELVLHTPPPLDAVIGAHYLLPNYDEYLIAYRHRGAVIDPHRSRNLGVFTSVEHPHHIVLDGRVAGSWRRAIGPRAATIGVTFYAQPSAAARAAIVAEAARYGQALGVPCDVEVAAPANRRRLPAARQVGE